MDKYWVTLGRKWGGGYYPQSLIDTTHWLDSAVRDTSVAVILEIGFDPKTGETTAKVLKNTPAGAVSEA